MPRFYRAKDAPTSPEQGDLRYNESNNRLETYTGTAWGTIYFSTVNAQGTTTTTLNATTATVDSFIPSAGFVSLNTATPAFYMPAGAGAITGEVASLGSRVAYAYNTTGRALMIRHGGSWFTTASLNLA